MALLIEHPEDLRTETLNADETLCRDFFDDVWVRGNEDRVSDYLDDHFHWNAYPGYTDDRGGYAKLVRDMHTAFPDLYANVDMLTCANGTVAAHWQMEGHHENEWMGIAPTHNHVHMEGIVMDQVRNGRIYNEISMGNDLEVFAQLGITDISAFTAPHAEAKKSGPTMWERFKRAMR